MRRTAHRHPSPAQHPPAEAFPRRDSGGTAGEPDPAAPEFDYVSLHLVLDVLSVRWSVLALHALAAGHLRFNQLLRHLSGISHKVLIATLRALQRDGFVAGPLTEPAEGGERAPGYRLTPTGWELLRLVAHIGQWAQENAPDVRRARGEFDRRQAAAWTATRRHPAPEAAHPPTTPAVANRAADRRTPDA